MHCCLQVYYREHAAGMYAAIPFGLAQSMVEEPFLLVQTAIYGVITYFMIHFEYSAGAPEWLSAIRMIKDRMLWNVSGLQGLLCMVGIMHFHVDVNVGARSACYISLATCKWPQIAKHSMPLQLSPLTMSTSS